MVRYRPSLVVAAVLLAGLGGFVDSLAYLNLGGFFASFMSGNTTRLGIALGTHDTASAMTAGALILSFICGIMVATILSVRFPARRKSAVMAAVTVMLALAALLSGLTQRRFPLMLLAMAMGAENGIFNRDGEVSVGLTYMTGNIVKLGQKLAAALLGAGAALGWVPNLLLWLGFAAGATLGGHLTLTIDGATLWAAAGGAAVLTLLIAALTWNAPAETAGTQATRV